MLIHPNSHAEKKDRRRQAVRLLSSGSVAVRFPRAGVMASNSALTRMLRKPRIIV